MSNIKIRIKRQDDFYLIKLLIVHPMETGRRRDQTTNETVAAHFIQSVKVEHNGQTIADCKLTTAVSQNPFISLRLKNAEQGDKISVYWLDNLGQSDHEETTIV